MTVLGDVCLLGCSNHLWRVLALQVPACGFQLFSSAWVS